MAARKVPRAPPPSSPAARAAMRGNRRTGTRPEMIVRRLVHRLGYRYRLHRADLPGKPDLVFPTRRAVIQVHGCFWHQHADPACPFRAKRRARSPYWDAKLARNAERDAAQLVELEALGWRVLTVWECECGDIESLGERVEAFVMRTSR